MINYGRHPKPIYRWSEIESVWMEVLMYCNGYKDAMRSPDNIETMRRRYGDPTPELRQKAINKLLAGYEQYLNTL